MSGGQQRQHLGDHFQREVARLAHAQAADGVAVKVHLDEAFGALAAQVAVHAALDDAEQGLGAARLQTRSCHGDFVLMGAEVIERAPRPGHGEAQALFGAAAFGGVLGALVEGHGDVGAEGDLHVHGVLGREEVAAAVEMRAEAHAFVRDFAQLAEAEDLEAAGVGEHGARPADEAVQAAHAADGFVPGAQIEVVGVAENDLRAQRFEHVLGDGLDRSGRADRHEDRGFDGLMGQIEPRAAAAGGRFPDDFELEAHHWILNARKP